MLDWLFHLFGFCPDHFAHLNLFDFVLWSSGIGPVWYLIKYKIRQKKNG